IAIIDVATAIQRREVAATMRTTIRKVNATVVGFVMCSHSTSATTIAATASRAAASALRSLIITGSMIAYSGERAGSPPYERREGLDWNVAGDSIVGKETWDVIQPLSATLRGA